MGGSKDSKSANNGDEIKIQNIVVSADLKTRLPLEHIALELEDAEYEPESFPGLVYRLKEPKASMLIFITGKIICAGAQSYEIAKKAIKKVVEELRSIGIDVKDDFSIKVENLVASANLNTRFDLNRIVYELGNCEYEPEQFPGLVYRMEDPKVVFLIFNSGRLVCTGASSEAEVKRAVEKLKSELRKIGAMK